MSYSKIEECVKNVGNKYALSTMVAKRIKDLMRSSPGLFADGNTKELTYVLDEIRQGKIVPTVVGN